MITEYDEAVLEIMKIKMRENGIQSEQYIGLDIRIREGKSTRFTLSRDEGDLPENTTDDDITRLKEKLELLKKIDEMLEKLKKYDTDYTPYIYPYQPWPVQLWRSPFWYTTNDNTPTTMTNRFYVTNYGGDW